MRWVASSPFRQGSHPVHYKHITTIAGALCAALAFAPSAMAATTASGSQAITGLPTAQLAAPVPSAYSFGTPAVGGAGNTPTEQVVNVKANAPWGLKISS